MLWPQTNLSHDLHRDIQTLLFAANAMDFQSFHEDISHLLLGIQGSIRILEDHLNLLAHIRHLFIIQFRYIFS